MRALTGLRFIAALAVVADHYLLAFVWWNPRTGLPQGAPAQPDGLLGLIHGGGLGVDCFFVLSGFILAYVYVTPTGGLRGTRSGFWVARLARIYPIYLVGLALDAVPFLLRPHHFDSALASVLASPLLIQAWIPVLGTWNAWDPPGWSLSVEAFFYLLFPFLLVRIAGSSRRRLLVLALTSVLAFALVPVLLMPLGLWRVSLWWWVDQIEYYSPLFRLPEFIFGMCLGIIHVRWHRWPSSALGLARHDYAWDLALVCIALALAGALMLPWPAHYSPSVLAMPLFGAAILLLAQQRGAIARLLSTSIFFWLGEISYGIYILHAPLWSWLAWIAHAAFHVAPSDPALLPLYLVLVLATAGLTYHIIERPARAAIRAVWASRAATRLAALATSHR